MSNDKAIFVCPDIYVNVKRINFETFQLGYGRLYPQQILIEVALHLRWCVDEVSLLNSEADDVIRLCISNVNALRDCPDLYVNVKYIDFETFQLSYWRLYPQQILIQVALYPRQCVDEVSLLNSEVDDVIPLSVSNDKAIFVCPDIYVNVKRINFETF